MNGTTSGHHAFLAPRIGGGLAALTAASFVLSGCGGKDQFGKVNGQPITRTEYVSALEKQQVTLPGAPPTSAERIALDQIIGNKVILSEASAANAMPSDDNVSRYYRIQKDFFEKTNPGKDYEKSLGEQGTTAEQIKNDIKVSLAETGLYAKRVKLGEDEVRKAFDDAKGQIGLPARVQLRMILVAPGSPDFAKAKQLLDAKTPFDQVAKQVNGTPSLKATGGLFVQTTPINTITPAYAGKVQQGAEGSFFGPVDFAVAQNQPPAKAWIKIEKKYPAYSLPFDDAALLIRRQLVQNKIMDPANAKVRQDIIQKKMSASFEPADKNYSAVWDSVKKAATDAGIGATPADPTAAAPPVAPIPTK